MTGSESAPAGTISWAELLAEAMQRLDAEPLGVVGAGSEVEARWIVEEAAGVTGSELSSALREAATVGGVARLDSMLARRCSGEPIQYVLGHWQFRTLDLLVDRRVLIPRPETEILAGLVIAELDSLDGTDTPWVVDLGTGSGAIGLSIVSERPGTSVIMTDNSNDAIAVARANLAGLGMVGSSTEIVAGRWFEALPVRLMGECAVIVSNPPYVCDGDQLDAAVLEWEPASALRAGADGLRDLREIIAGAPQWLRPGGLLVLEFAPAQRVALVEVIAEHGFDATIHRDLAGFDRVLTARLKP